MPSKSKSQQRLFGMVHACQKNGKCASPEVSKIAGNISDKDAEDFARTKHDGLPERKEKKKKKHKKKSKLKGFREFRQEQIEEALSSQERNLASLGMGELGELQGIVQQAHIPITYYIRIMKNCLNKVEQQLQNAGPQPGAESNTHQLALNILGAALNMAANGGKQVWTANRMAQGIQHGIDKSAAAQPAPQQPIGNAANSAPAGMAQ